MSTKKQKESESITPAEIGRRVLKEHASKVASTKKREEKGEWPGQKFKKLVGGENIAVKKAS